MSNFRPASGFNASDFVLSPNRNSSYRFEPYSIALKRNLANQSLSVSTLLAYIDKIGLAAGVVNVALGGVETITASRNLTSADSGKTFLMGTITASVNINLPTTPSVGDCFEFRQNSTPGGTFNWNVNSQTLNAMFGVMFNTVAIIGTSLNGQTVATFSQNPANGVIADYMKIICMRTSPVRWHVTGVTRNASGITFI